MNVLYRSFAIGLLAVAVGACQASSDDAARAPAFELKVYNVPAAESKAIAGSLGAALESAEFRVGTKSRTEMRVTQPFPGVVMVLAPPSVQPSIANAIAQLQKAHGKQPAPGAASVPLQVQAWIVQARAGVGEDATELRPLAKALQQVRSSLGSSHFVLADSATMSIDAPTHDDSGAGNGKLVTSRGNMFVVHAAATGKDGFVMSLQLSSAGAAAAFRDLSTTISMQPGEYVVLAQAPPASDAARRPDAALMNLVVARVQRMTPAAR